MNSHKGNNWDRAVSEYCMTGHVSQCPVCGGKQVETEGFISAIDRRERVWIFCGCCGARTHCDGPQGLNRHAPAGTVLDLCMAG